jgi:protein-L-isoaspartate(D-aspartate) O-methyltransferase
MNDIDRAFEAVKRHNFLPPDFQDSVGVDAPLPIGFGQTNSQPSTVRLMLEWLDPRRGDKVLDVGSGSGWTTALIGYLVGLEGKVYAVEKIPELAVFGAKNCLKAGINNVQFFEADDSIGLPLYAPYDRILVSASANRVPEELLEQLGEGGIMVIPVGETVRVIEKAARNRFESREYPGFMFVPLV